MVRSIWLVIVLALSLALPGCLGYYRYQSAACKQRGAAFDARVEKLKRDARERLAIGAKREVVIQFFADQGIPVTFGRGEATGSINTSGCAPSGCGTDAALIGLRVKVDDGGTVISEPIVVAFYTDCV